MQVGYEVVVSRQQLIDPFNILFFPSTDSQLLLDVGAK